MLVGHLVTQLDREDEVPRQVEVEIHAHVVAVEIVLVLESEVLLGLVITARLVKIGQRHEIAHPLAAAADVRVVVLLERKRFDQFVEPIDVGIENRRGTGPEFLQRRRLEEHFVLGCAFVALRLVAEHRIVVGTQRLRQNGRLQSRDIGTETHFRLADLALPRGDQDHAVGAADTEHGRRRGVFQNVQALDFGRVDVVVSGALDAVDQNQRRRTAVFSVAIPRTRRSTLSLPNSPEVCRA